MRIGPASASGPISYLEIDAFMRSARIELEGHECEMLRKWSIFYCNDFARSGDPLLPDPDMTEEDRKESAKKAFSEVARRYK